MNPDLRATVVGIINRHVRGLGFIGHTVKVTNVRATKAGYSASVLLQQGTAERRYRARIVGTKITVTAVAPASKIGSAA